MQAIPINRTDYCQFLTVSQKNYNLTFYAEHARKCSHDVINGFLENEKYSPSLLWEHIKNDVIVSPNRYTISDDKINQQKEYEENRDCYIAVQCSYRWCYYKYRSSES